jgi:alpha-methylacyl-CoA racemase
MTSQISPLADIRVVELSVAGSAATCASFLVAFGAQLVRIGRAGAPNSVDAAMSELTSVDFGADRETLPVDLKSAAGKETALRLVERADAVIEGFRPGAAERLGLGPGDCLARNSRLVYCRATGWGQQGERAGVAGHDANFVAISGALRALAREGSAPIVPLNLIGEMAGGLHAALAVVSSVHHARRTDAGVVIDAAQAETAAALMHSVYAMHAAGDWGAPGRNHLDGGAPFFNVYETSDGEYVAVTAIEPHRYELLVRSLGLDPAELPARLDRDSWPAVTKRLAEVFRSRSRSEWCDLLENSEACLTPVLSMDEAPSHPVNETRGVFDPLPRLVPPMWSADHSNERWWAECPVPS